MEVVYADIKLINYYDVVRVERNVISQEQIREMTVKMIVGSEVDTIINEKIQECLQFPFVSRRKLTLKNGIYGEFDFVGPVKVQFKDMIHFCQALVLKGDGLGFMTSSFLEGSISTCNPSIAVVPS